MAQRVRGKENFLLMVLSLSFVLGMAAGLAVYYAWRSGMIVPGVNVLSVLALIGCPPFVMSMAITPVQESDLGLTLLVGAIVFANAFLYAGVAAGVYAVVGFARRKG